MKANDEMLRVEVPVSYLDLVMALGQMEGKELVKLILKLDLQMAEVGFTEDLVKGLVKSLKADAADVDIKYIDWSLVK